MRFLLVSVALVAALAAPASAQAELHRSDTFVYLEIDGAAAKQGLAEMQIVKLLGDEKLRAFFKPTLDRLGLDPADVAQSLLKKAPFQQFLKGRASVGVRGLRFVVREGDGTETRFEITPDNPVDARMAYKLFGLMARTAQGQMPAEIEMTSDVLVTVEPGPALKQMVSGILENPPGELKVGKANVGGKEVLHGVFRENWFGGSVLVLNVYADLSGDRWLLSTSPDTLAAAMAGGPRDALAIEPLKKRFTGGRPLVFGYVDLAVGMKMFSSLIPPIVGEMNDINGLNSLKGIGVGISIVDGGLRESVGLVFDGNPKGIWRILDAFPGGVKSLETAPPGALGAFAVKFDANIFLQRFREITAELLPGNEKTLDVALQHEFEAMGFDFAKEILPALGDEVSLLVYPVARNQFLPDIVLGMDTRDEAALKRLVEKLKGLVTEDMARIEPVKIADGIDGYRVFSRLPVALTVAVHDRHLFVASRPELLADVLLRWGGEGEAAIAKDGKVFPQVLKATNGGSHDDVALLAYVNARAVLSNPMVFPLIMGQLPKQMFDTRAPPDMKRLAGHLTGAAVSLRNNPDGLTLDLYSPMGVILPSIAFAIVDEMQRRERWAQRRVVVVPEMVADATLGISVQSSDGTGVTILGMARDGPVAKAGLKADDKIVAIGGVQIGLIEDLEKELKKYKAGAEVLIKVERGNGTKTFTVTLGRIGEFLPR